MKKSKTERPKLRAIVEIFDGKEFKYFHHNFELRLKVKDFDRITHKEFQKAVDSISNSVGWELRVKESQKKEGHKKKDWCSKFGGKPKRCEKPTYYDYYRCVCCSMNPMYNDKL